MNIDSYLYSYKENYFKLPRNVKMFLGELYGSIPLEIRFGEQYRIQKKIIETFENYNEQFKIDFIYNKTYETLQFAYTNIPHYTNKFNEYGFKPEDFKSLADIKKVPVLTKSMVQNNLKNLNTKTFEKSIEVQTGGSTFKPTKFFVSLKTCRAKERVYTNYIFSKCGYHYRDKSLVLRDRDGSDEKNNIYWNYEMVANQLWLSTNHINQKYIKMMVLEIEKFKPKFVWGYPSNTSFFINECKKMGIQNINGVSAVFLSSEIIFPEQLEKISNFFGCEVLSHYGHRESTIVAYRINNGKYNFLNSYGLPRVVNNELITTTFDNFVMPLINYKTQDLVNGNKKFIDNSDIVSHVQNIEGRMQYFVVAKDGTLRTALSIGMGHDLDPENIKEAQYFQDSPGKVRIDIVARNKEKVDTERIIKIKEDFVKNQISFDIKFVDKIEKTPLGKWKTCIQKLDIDKYIF